MTFEVQEFGEEHTTAYRVYITHNQQVISPFHDIPAYPEAGNTRIVHVVNEIPRFTNAKREINKEEVMNPIKQDMKNGKVRFVANLFPKKGYLWNYGAIPQTWESDVAEDPWTRCRGDNDPIDAVEIGSAVLPTGKVYRAKILGAVALIDGGECDWKVVVINSEDPLYDRLNGIRDIEEHLPGLLQETIEWFRNYKIPGGSPPNRFALDEEYLDAEEAAQVVQTTYRHWVELIKEKEHQGISLANMTQESTPGYTTDPCVPTGDAFISRPEPIEAQRFFYLPPNPK